MYSLAMTRGEELRQQIAQSAQRIMDAIDSPREDAQFIIEESLLQEFRDVINEHERQTR